MERLSFDENVPNFAASEDLSFEQFLSQMKLTEMTFDQINQHDPCRLVLVNMYDSQWKLMSQNTEMTPSPIEDSDDNEPLSEEEEENINGEIGLSYIDIIIVMF